MFHRVPNGPASFALAVLFCVSVASRCLTSTPQPAGTASPSRAELAKLLDGQDTHLRAYAVYTIAYRFSEDAAELVRFCSDPDPLVRRAAIFCLGLLRHETAKEAFVQALKDPHYGVRRAAVFALGNLATADALDKVSQSLDDADPLVRQLAAFAISRSGDKSYVPRLIPLLQDESPRVRRAAAFALGSLGDPSALASLRQLYRDRKSSEPAERIAAANREVEKAMKKNVNLDCKFVHFVQILDKLSEVSGIEIRVDDEVLFKLNTSAADPTNLSTFRLSMWDVPFETALQKVVQTVGGYYYIESGVVNISSSSYAAYDTPLRLEVAAAMALLGDRSALGEVRKYSSDRRFGKRAQDLLAAIGAR
jgi:hypothetical protein